MRRYLPIGKSGDRIPDAQKIVTFKADHVYLRTCSTPEPGELYNWHDKVLKSKAYIKKKFVDKLGGAKNPKREWNTEILLQ